jgi:hypothetical protein
MALILVGCEESQAITIELRKLGHQAFSNDLKPCTGNYPEWHIQGDVFEVIKLKKWDMGIFHPPCTYLTNSDKALPFEQRRPHPLYPNRRQDMLDSVEFVKALYNCEIPLVAIENPIGLLSTRFRKPDQIIQPYQFGDEASKGTCLWLKGLPKLTHTKLVGKGEFTEFKSGKRMSTWMAEALKLPKAERQTVRSKTFKGIAIGMATQWTEYLKSIGIN